MDSSGRREALRSNPTASFFNRVRIGPVLDRDPATAAHMRRPAAFLSGRSVCENCGLYELHKCCYINVVTIL